MYKLTKCSLCGKNQFYTLYKEKHEYVKPWRNFIEKEDFPISIEGLICKHCSWICQKQAYGENELERLYSPDKDKASGEHEKFADKNAKYRGTRIYQTVEPWLKRTSHVLDVGGRNGELMASFLNEAHIVSVLDRDGGKPISEKVKKIRRPFLEWGGDKYDLVIMSHILEHTESPLEFLMHARKILKCDGLVFIEVPFELFTSIIKRHSGDHRHLCYYTRETLKAYLKISGFECISCQLINDIVGDKIPLIRAVAKKQKIENGLSKFNPNKLFFYKSLLDVIHPTVLYYIVARLVKKIKFY